MKTHSPTVNAALDELEHYGVRDIDVDWRGKHPKVLVRVNGGAQHVIGCSATPADHEAPAKARADVRRLLRALGVIDAPSRPAPPPRQLSRVELLERRLARVERAVFSNNTPVKEAGTHE
jgi:hypothetical protein